MAALDGVVGIKSITVDDATLVPTRGTLHVQGAGVALSDDPDARETILTFVAGEGQSGSAISPPTLSADVVGAFTPDGVDAAKIIRVYPAVSVALHGLAAPSASGELRKTFVVLQTMDGRIELKHASVSAPANTRFACPGNASYYILQNGSIDLLYDTLSEVWRLVV